MPVGFADDEGVVGVDLDVAPDGFTRVRVEPPEVDRGFGRRDVHEGRAFSQPYQRVISYLRSGDPKDRLLSHIPATSRGMSKGDGGLEFGCVGIDLGSGRQQDIQLLLSPFRISGFSETGSDVRERSISGFDLGLGSMPVCRAGRGKTGSRPRRRWWYGRKRLSRRVQIQIC